MDVLYVVFSSDKIGIFLFGEKTHNGNSLPTFPSADRHPRLCLSSVSARPLLPE